MRLLMLLSLTLPLGSPAAAQERIARVGQQMWSDRGAHHDAAHRAFLVGLAEQGFLEGRNLELLQRSADSNPARLKLLARELAAAKVNVFFAPSTAMASDAWYADHNTRIVFATILDLVRTEFVKSLARPSTRATGVVTMTAELTGKRMQMLVHAVPGPQRIGVMLAEKVIE